MKDGKRSRMKPVLLGAVLGGILILCAFAAKDKNAETEVKDALEKLEQAKSMETTLTMNMDMKILGIDLGAAAVMDMVSFSDPLKVKADLAVDLGWLGSSEYQVYACETEGARKAESSRETEVIRTTERADGRTDVGRAEDTCRIYVKKGRKWVDEDVESDQLKRYDGKQLIKTYLEQLDELVKEGEEELDTGKAIRYRGVVHNTGLENVLLDTGCMEMLLTMMDQDLLKPLGSFFRKNEELIPKLMRRAEDMEVLLWIDQKTGYPVRCSMDITYMVNAALEEFRNADAQDSGEGKTGFLQKAKTKLFSTVQIPCTQIVIDCGDFNDAEDFQMPE